MVHPNLYGFVNYDPEKYSGFAFGGGDAGGDAGVPQAAAVAFALQREVGTVNADADGGGTSGHERTPFLRVGESIRVGDRPCHSWRSVHWGGIVTALDENASVFFVNFQEDVS